MSWIHSGTLPSVEDKSRYTAPRDPQDASESAMEPAEAGREARERCEARESNPYREGEARAEWFEGWDGPDFEDGDDTAPDYDADEITEPLDCMSVPTVSALLHQVSQSAMLQFAMLKHELRGMREMPASMGRYVETLRHCHDLQTHLRRRIA